MQAARRAPYESIWDQLVELRQNLGRFHRLADPNTPVFLVDEEGVIHSSTPAFFGSRIKYERSPIPKAENDWPNELSVKDSDGLNLLNLKLNELRAKITNGHLITTFSKTLGVTTRMDVHLDGDVELSMDAEVQALELGVIKEHKFPKVTLAKVMHPISPPFFLVTDLSLEFKVGAELTAYGTFGFGFTKRGHINDLGFTYDPGEFLSWTPWREDGVVPVADVDFQQTEMHPFTGNFVGEGELKLQADVVATTLIWGLAGPELVLLGVESGPVGSINTSGDLKVAWDTEIYSKISLAGKFVEELDIAELSYKHIWGDYSKVLYSNSLNAGSLEFLRQPTSQNINEGSSAHLQCSVDAPGSVSYQWFYNESPIPYENSSSLKLANVGTFNAGNYHVKVTGSSNTIYSEKASVGVFSDECDYIDTYPYASEDPNNADPWLFYFRECTSYVAWKINDVSRKAFSNYMLGGHFSNALNWDDNAQAIGFTVNHLPAVGAIAHWDADEGAGSLGHVAFVEAVAPDGTVSISEYNFSTAHGYGARCGIRAPRYIHIFTDAQVIAPAPAGFAYIPAGSFQMGDSFSEGSTNERPVHSVYLSGFYMGRTEVTYAQWQEVYNWAVANNYSFDNAGAGKAANHPVHTVSWYDVVKWCNAASEREGLAPVYRTGDGSVYRTGQLAPVIAYGNRGYRLPTEAEWEKAARGDLSSKRFPWGDTISHSEANYRADGDRYPYDSSPFTDLRFHPSYDDGNYPYTSPVGSFAPNGYGLYDMAGNVWEWCGDWYADYPSSSVSNPTGPGSGAYRVRRGGGWNSSADLCRVAFRGRAYPVNRYYGIGFRLARSQ